MSQIQVSADATNITLSWPEPFDGFSTILHYVVILRESGSNFMFLKEVNAISSYSSVSIMGLLPYTEYFARIIPFNRVGAAVNVSELKITTVVSGRFLFNFVGT